ncbi:MAG: 5'-3' exonuclease H3TH domain-containing protein, partial [Lacrimispora sp.]
MGKKLLLIDGSSMLKGAFYGLPAGGAGGIHNLITKVLEAGEIDYLAAVFSCKDENLLKVFEDFFKQQEALEEMLAAMNVQVLNKEGWISADIIASLVKEGQQEDIETVILSEDRKLLQAVKENTSLRIPEAGEEGVEFKIYSPDSIREEYGLDPVALGGMLSLSGSWGIGEKTACRLIKQYQSIENLYNHLEEVESQRIREILSAHREEIKQREKDTVLNEDCDIRLDYTKALAKNQVGKKGLSESGTGASGLSGNGAENKGSLKDSLGENSSLDDLQTGSAGAAGFSALNPPQESPGAANTLSSPSSIEANFRMISDFAEAEAIFSRCGKDSRLGLQLIIEDKAVSALALALSETECFCIIPQGFLTPDYLASKAGEICGKSSH